MYHFVTGDYVFVRGAIRLVMGVRPDGWIVLDRGPDQEPQNLTRVPWLAPCMEVCGEKTEAGETVDPPEILPR